MKLLQLLLVVAGGITPLQALSFHGPGLLRVRPQAPRGLRMSVEPAGAQESTTSVPESLGRHRLTSLPVPEVTDLQNGTSSLPSMSLRGGRGGLVGHYFRYMGELWRPETKLPRKVYIARMLRQMKDLESVLDRESARLGLPASADRSERVPRTELKVMRESDAPTPSAPSTGSPDSPAALADPVTTTLDGPALDGSALDSVSTAQRMDDLRVAAGALSDSLSSGLAALQAEEQLKGSSPNGTKKVRSSLTSRLITGWALGAGCTWWIFSGNVGHATGLAPASIAYQ